MRAVRTPPLLKLFVAAAMADVVDMADAVDVVDVVDMAELCRAAAGCDEA